MTDVIDPDLLLQVLDEQVGRRAAEEIFTAYHDAVSEHRRPATAGGTAPNALAGGSGDRQQLRVVSDADGGEVLQSSSYQQDMTVTTYSVRGRGQVGAVYHLQTGAGDRFVVEVHDLDEGHDTYDPITKAFYVDPAEARALMTGWAADYAGRDRR